MRAWRTLAAALALFACIAVPAPAQQAPVDPDSLIAEMAALMNEKGRGFAASQAVLSRSFAAHLHGEADPRTVAELSALGADYDPQSGSLFSAGMLYFHLARPIALFRQIGGGPNEVFARIMEIRLRWLAGHDALALEQAETLIGLMDAPDAGWSDPEMVSLLADAAVLAWRAGRVEQAEALFARARGCGVQRCPDDLVFGWLGKDRKSSDERFAGYDPAALRARAEADAAVLFPDDAQVPAEIALEERLMRGGLAAVLPGLARRAQQGGVLSEPERRVMGRAAARLAKAWSFFSYLMGDDSLAGRQRLATMVGDAAGKDDLFDDGMNYEKVLALYDETYLRNVPLLHLLLSRSDLRGAEVVAETLRARVMLAHGQSERAAETLSALVNGARARGVSDAALFSPLMDLWGAARLAGDDRLAETAWEATAACRAKVCGEDLVLGFFDAAEKLPAVDWDGLIELQMQAGEAFVRDSFPDDPAMLAALYPVSGLGQARRPMDAARLAALSVRYAEAVPGFAAADLVGRAQAAMDVLIYAGKYAEALEMGDRIAARAGDGALGARFYQMRARAAFRVDDARAGPFYDRAVTLILAEEGGSGVEGLALDLMDTDFLDALDRLAAGARLNPSIVARLRARQGRFAEAADLLAEERRRRERAGGGARMAAFFTARAERHLAGRDLDAAVAALRAARDAEDGEVSADHHHLYRYFWDLKTLAYQEAAYRDAAGQGARAEHLRGLGGGPAWFRDGWAPLPDRPEAADLARYEARERRTDTSYDLIRHVIDLRDFGNYEAAARYMKNYRWVAVAAEAEGRYVDAQALWQMAFTFARVGETGIAFDLMNRAARIAARLSFEGAGGAGGGTLQLLERDRWRYLLFVDIAWAAASGQAPEDMLVVSRY